MAEFRDAVRRRDRSALESLFPDDFDGYGQNMDDRIGWLMRSRSMILQMKPEAYTTSDSGTIMRSIIRGSSESNCWMLFEFRPDRKWYVIRFGCHSE